MAEFHKLLARLRNALESPAPAATARHLKPGAVPVAPVAHRAQLASRFARELEAVGGRFLGMLGPAEMARRLSAIAREAGARKAAVGEGALCNAAPLAKALEDAGCAVFGPGRAKEDDRARTVAELARCDLTVAEAHYAIASSGTFAVLGTPACPNSLTLLAPISVIIAHVERLMTDLAAVLGALDAGTLRGNRLTLITGPSRTADIEKRLVLGVHGPKALYGAIIWPHDE